jgi:hypothetical protein
MFRLPTLIAVPESQRGPMDDTIMFVFAAANIVENRFPTSPIPANDLPAAISLRYTEALAECFIAQILIGRLKTTDLVFSPDVTAMLIALSTNPGRAVSWAYYLYEETRKRGALTMHDLALDFPMGFPTEEGAHAYWDSQKGRVQEPPMKGVDNVLDQEETWKPPVEETA